MKTFEYRGYDSQGKSRRGLVEAATLKQAREQLAAEGILAIRQYQEPAGLQIRLRRQSGVNLVNGAGLPAYPFRTDDRPSDQ